MFSLVGGRKSPICDDRHLHHIPNIEMIEMIHKESPVMCKKHSFMEKCTNTYKNPEYVIHRMRKAQSCEKLENWSKQYEQYTKPKKTNGNQNRAKCCSKVGSTIRRGVKVETLSVDHFNKSIQRDDEEYDIAFTERIQPR